jgi:hypothetical protein
MALMLMIIYNHFTEICQLRLDFEAFDIGSDVGGTCSNDMFVVTQTPRTNSIVPVLCGLNTGQHGKISITYILTIYLP